MKDLGRGIWITDFIGGNTNTTTGDYSVGIVGQLFENGEPVQAVAEMNIAGNALEFWPKLVEVANDPWPYSPLRDAEPGVQGRRRVGDLTRAREEGGLRRGGKPPRRAGQGLPLASS